MPQVTGEVVSNDGTGFTADFLVGTRIYTYTAVFTSPVPAFAASNATLAYDSTDQLTGTPPFSGVVGLNHLGFSISTTSAVAGGLDETIASASSVGGSPTVTEFPSFPPQSCM